MEYTTGTGDQSPINERTRVLGWSEEISVRIQVERAVESGLLQEPLLVGHVPGTRTVLLRLTAFTPYVHAGVEVCGV